MILALIAMLLFPPCAAEDSANCYWDAAHRGSGTGTSFVDILGTAYYLPAEGI